MADDVKVIDASGLVLGRASSHIAKRLLKGEHLIVVNADRAVVLGSHETVVAGYTAARARGSVRKGPFYPRTPERIFRRTVRGMLPFKRSTGRVAFQRFMSYNGLPPEYEGKPLETIESAKAAPTLIPPITLSELSKLLGVKH